VFRVMATFDFEEVMNALVSLIDRFVVQLSQVFMLRVFPVGTNC
jgi:hypothetical protein